jgi:pyruvate kinase
MMRHTKIIATIGPASQSDAVLQSLIEAGVDICRLNFSHGSHESHADTYQRIRQVAARTGKIVAIMQDLSGPKIRTGRLAGGRPSELKEGDTLRIVTGDREGGPGIVYTSYGELAKRVRPGDPLLLDDGRIELRVIETNGTEILTTVVDGGLLGEHKGINAPGVELPTGALTSKDIADLRFGVKLGVDMVALSFVRSAEDLRQARDILKEAGAEETLLLAKLERPEAVTNLDEILGACQGVMVARGDLGLEMPLEKVPTLQKEITRRAHAVGIPVIVATQVLESMRFEPRPTRAEVSDAANAVDDAVDAIMLAGETAVGAFPLKAVEILNAVIREAERLEPATTVHPVISVPTAPHAQALAEAAVTLADYSRAFAIVAITRAGTTARVLSALRPRVRIFAATDRESVARSLMLYRGVCPLTTDTGKDVDSAGSLLKGELRARDLVPHGAVVVFINTNADLSRPDANYVMLQRME